MGFCFHFSVQAMPDSNSPSFLFCTLCQQIICMSQMILPLSVPLSIAVVGDALPVAAVFSEDVEDFAPQVWLPRFNQALGVDHQSAGLPVLVASHHILWSWRREQSINCECHRNRQNRRKITVGSTLCKKTAHRYITILNQLNAVLQ